MNEERMLMLVAAVCGFVAALLVAWVLVQVIG